MIYPLFAFQITKFDKLTHCCSLGGPYERCPLSQTEGTDALRSIFRIVFFRVLYFLYLSLRIFWNLSSRNIKNLIQSMISIVSYTIFSGAISQSSQRRDDASHKTRSSR